MSVERLVRSFAGFFVLASLALGVRGSPLYVSVYFLWVTAFVGANLLQSGFTGLCPLESLLRRLGVGRTRVHTWPVATPEQAGGRRD